MSQKKVLFPRSFTNPLEKRVGKPFFSKLPRKIGVYKMYSAGGAILYVGKSKNLRDRLFTYRRANYKNSSRKTLRLVKMVHSIEYVLCETEEEALLMENDLIRRLKPLFNRAKKSPESYYYLSLRQTDTDFHFRLGMDLPDEAENIYGAFKGHGVVRGGTGALLRQLYLIEYPIDTLFKLPTVLTNKFTPSSYKITLNNGIILEESFFKLLQLYLNGRSLDMLSYLTDLMDERNLLEKYIGRLILRDLNSMKTFFKYCLKRNRGLIETLELNDPYIPQKKLDDYLIKAAFKE